MVEQLAEAWFQPLPRRTSTTLVEQFEAGWSRLTVIADVRRAMGDYQAWSFAGFGATGPPSGSATV